jgi:hypothetical protein
MGSAGPWDEGGELHEWAARIARGDGDVPDPDAADPELAGVPGPADAEELHRKVARGCAVAVGVVMMLLLAAYVYVAFL